MTHTELRDLLLSIDGATFVSFSSITDPSWARTKGNPYVGKVKKHSRVNGVINWVYENAVNRQRKREGLEADFEAHPRKWGQRLAGTPFVVHKGKVYLEVKVESCRKPEYFDQDGNPVDPELLKPWLRQSDDSGRQEVEKPVILRDYTLDNITSITCNGNVYELAA